MSRRRDSLSLVRDPVARLHFEQWGGVHGRHSDPSHRRAVQHRRDPRAKKFALVILPSDRNTLMRRSPMRRSLHTRSDCFRFAPSEIQAGRSTCRSNSLTIFASSAMTQTQSLPKCSLARATRSFLSRHAPRDVLLTLDKGIPSLPIYPPEQLSGVVLFHPDANGRRAVAHFLLKRLPDVIALDLAGIWS